MAIEKRERYRSCVSKHMYVLEFGSLQIHGDRLGSNHEEQPLSATVVFGVGNRYIPNLDQLGVETGIASLLIYVCSGTVAIELWHITILPRVSHANVMVFLNGSCSVMRKKWLFLGLSVQFSHQENHFSCMCYA